MLFALETSESICVRKRDTVRLNKQEICNWQTPQQKLIIYTFVKSGFTFKQAKL